MTKTYDVFLSYPHEEREWVQQLVHELSERGLRVWYGEAEIKPGQLWGAAVQQALDASDYFVLIITAKTAQSNWAALELGAALGLSKAVIPVVADNLPMDAIPGPARLRQLIVKTDPAKVADEIMRAITKPRSALLANGMARKSLEARKVAA